MQPYRITIPTKIYYGRNIWKETIKAQESLLKGNIMIVTTGRSLYRLGYVEALKQELQQCQCVRNVIIFDQISANPKLSEIREGILTGRREHVDILVGFGGGSSIDAAKAVAVGVKSKDDIEVYFYQGREPGEDTLPIIAIPTTAGTGSELSKAAILTDEVQKVKSGIRGEVLYPVVAIVDSCFTESVPMRGTMETGFDVVAHAVESYISKASSPYTRMQSETAVRIAGECIPLLISCQEDTEAREKMCFASMLMGINLGNASTCLPHRLQYPLGAHTDTSHGAGLAALFTAWIQCEYQYEPTKIERMAELLIGKHVKGKEESARSFQIFIKAMGLPCSLYELGITKLQLPEMIDGVSGNIANDPASQEEGIIPRLYETAWQGIVFD